jgi:hypothetical protein
LIFSEEFALLYYEGCFVPELKIIGLAVVAVILAWLMFRVVAKIFKVVLFLFLLAVIALFIYVKFF